MFADIEECSAKFDQTKSSLANCSSNLGQHVANRPVVWSKLAERWSTLANISPMLAQTCAVHLRDKHVQLVSQTRKDLSSEHRHGDLQAGFRCSRPAGAPRRVGNAVGPRCGLGASWPGGRPRWGSQRDPTGRELHGLTAAPLPPGPLGSPPKIRHQWYPTTST